MQIASLLSMRVRARVCASPWVSAPPAPHSHRLLAEVDRRLPPAQAPDPLRTVLKGAELFPLVLSLRGRAEPSISSPAKLTFLPELVPRPASLGIAVFNILFTS